MAPEPELVGCRPVLVFRHALVRPDAPPRPPLHPCAVRIRPLAALIAPPMAGAASATLHRRAGHREGPEPPARLPPGLGQRQPEAALPARPRSPAGLPAPPWDGLPQSRPNNNNRPVNAWWPTPI